MIFIFDLRHVANTVVGFPVADRGGGSVGSGRPPPHQT